MSTTKIQLRRPPSHPRSDHVGPRRSVGVSYQIAERAEALGFHSVWVGDSLTARPRIDALTTLAAVGARTTRVRLGTAIFLAALRHPIMLAYQLASLDWLTGGRVDLGVGYGRPKEPAAEHEFEILGLDPSARMKMSEELVQVMRRLWRENDVTYDGKFTRFDHVTIEPKPSSTWRRADLAGVEQRRTRPQARRPARRRLDQQHQKRRTIRRVLAEDSELRRRRRAASPSRSIQAFTSPWRPAARTRWSRANNFLARVL